jgi:hypothetical protein
MTKDGRLKRSTAILLTFLAGGIFFVACHSSEVVAPTGATITLAANPATIILSNGVQAAPVNVLATVSDQVGVPLPGQDVRFTQTSGTLTPLAGTPVRTNSLGNALAVLTNATTTTTVTATSGKATATLSLQTASCAIQTIALNPLQVTFTSCSNTSPGGNFPLTATVTDTTGKACQGISISFNVGPPPDSTNDSQVVVSPASGTTDANGVVTTSVTLDQGTCTTRCTGKNCNTAGQAITASGGGIQSAQSVVVNISI